MKRAFSRGRKKSADATTKATKASETAAAKKKPPPAPRQAALLAKLGIKRPLDLVLHFPFRYEDETRITPVEELIDDVAAQAEVTVLSTEVAYRPRRQLVVRTVDDDGSLLALRFLNFYGSQQKQFAHEARFRVFGEPRHGYFGMEMVHPRVTRVERGDPLPAALTPIYPTTAGIGQGTLRKKILAALDTVALDDTLPEAVQSRFGLIGFAQAVRALHFPLAHQGADYELAMQERSNPAWQRIKFDELLAQQLSLKRAHAARRAKRAPVLGLQPHLAGNAHELGVIGASPENSHEMGISMGQPEKPHELAVSKASPDSLVDQLLETLPFALTPAQVRVTQEIRADLSKPYPMQRLLQGDVGSGKTVVAALAALAAIDAGWQAAFMAPTEILAEQHYRKLTAWLQPMGLRVAWLTGSLGAADKRHAKAAIASGAAHIAVGTHALFQDDVQFAKLALVVVDEQHRFGVGQRLALKAKGEARVAPLLKPGAHGADNDAKVAPGVSPGIAANVAPNVVSDSVPNSVPNLAPNFAPHQLAMSATPIPRTLAMTYYADMDVSTIDQLPAGRQPIATKLVADSRRDEIVARVGEACAAGGQAYWVCPLIEESEALELQTAIDTYAALSTALPHLRVGLVHGRLKPAEKALVMDAFIRNEVQLLVATTVIEVGVDVPNASLMVIEHAERFGLSQLHQLRGRVGRGARASTCVLLYAQPLGLTARERLKVIYGSADGFEIAREDLRIRGPGEMLGARQSGDAVLRFADLAQDQALIGDAQALADEWLANDLPAAERHLARWLANREAYLNA
jgi:ATP-dependent DNA helicase RecG